MLTNNQISIAWKDLNVSVKSLFGKNETTILSGISGEFYEKSLNVLMGASGSGKSKLLKCLNASNNYIISSESKIYVNKNVTNIRKCFIYQNQSQRLMTGLTVSQALTYSSKLKNPIQYNDQKVDHKKIVSDIMQELLISDIKDNKIDNCSGGQIKRLSIGLELTSVCKPYLLFIDEPTTGLDTHSAIMVISCLKQLSRNHNMSIIISIHQPNNELYQMFDTIYVLAKGGQTLYSGFTNNLYQFITDNQIECNKNQFPLDMLMKLSYNGNDIPNINNNKQTKITNNINNNLILMKSQSVGIQ
ncbi:ATP-binding cassette sub-family G member 1-like [Oppia nitens]|uniref:ATP-binding cassette sub-family G member 1-like n=1 Tax=Oppia nitens TaxID=1686743 RepID=UPI0023DA1A72|nr:ATP-binding cassette sub-family G member 1-like [Oppia nitens]